MALEKQEHWQFLKGRSGVVILCGVAFGAALLAALAVFILQLLLGGHAGERDHSQQQRSADAVVHYAAIDPPLVVNFSSGIRSRYLQLGIEVMAHDEAAIADFKQHMPVIRDRLIILLNQKNFDELSTPEGKEALRQEILQAIRSILEERTGKTGVEAVYFTDFVMQ